MSPNNNNIKTLPESGVHWPVLVEEMGQFEPRASASPHSAGAQHPPACTPEHPPFGAPGTPIGPAKPNAFDPPAPAPPRYPHPGRYPGAAIPGSALLFLNVGVPPKAGRPEGSIRRPHSPPRSRSRAGASCCPWGFYSSPWWRLSWCRGRPRPRFPETKRRGRKGGAERARGGPAEAGREGRRGPTQGN